MFNAIILTAATERAYNRAACKLGFYKRFHKRPSII